MSSPPSLPHDYRQTITEYFRRSPAFTEFLRSHREGKQVSLSGLTPTAAVLFLGNYLRELLEQSIEKHPQNLIHVLPTDLEAGSHYESLRLFFPDLKEVYLYPSLSELPGKLTPLPAGECHTRHTLIHRWGRTPSPALIFTSLKAVLEKIPSPLPSSKQLPSLIIRVGDTRPLMEWGERLEEAGYRRSHEVVVPGEYAIRNGILDLYSSQESYPHRIYFWDEEVEMIKPFHPHSQQLLPVREGEKLETLTLCSPRMSDYHDYEDGGFLKKIFSGKAGEEMKTLWRGHQEFSWALLEPFLDNQLWRWTCLPALVPHPKILIADEMLTQDSTAFQEIIAPYHRHRKWDKETLFAPPEKRFFTPEGLRDYDILKVSRYPLTEGDSIPFGARKPMGFKKDVNKCREYLMEEAETGKKIFLFTSNPISGKKLSEFFKELNPILIGEENPSQDGDFLIICHPLLEGMDYNKQLLITDFELFRKKPKAIVRGQGLTEVLEYFTDLRKGDYVVHINQGIGHYLGLKRIGGEDSQKDYLEIAYQGGDKLFVPVEQMNLVQRYIGNKGKSPRLDTLGGKSWDRIKQRVKKQLEVLTRELIALYRKRRDHKKVPCIQDDYFQELFESFFPFQETEDQLRASEEIKRDLEGDIVMDRLLCGDVGFGKTEVAMRAVFKAVFSGRQAAVLVPTTILSLQHFQRFEERFRDFPVTIRVLNRFQEHSDQKEILRETAEGKVEILIGTHALLSEKITFKKLGLLVIDEEQKFGVKQKEKIKKNYPHVDTLSLSATPIPRTLHLSLSSIRSLSVLNIPPQNRQAVKTFVLQWDLNVIKEAVRRERERGGQIFFVHNQVSSLASFARILMEEMPEVQLRIAHGQMAGRELEKVMDDFVHHRFDMLVSTSIIESGMDLNRVNTLMVNNCDHFGLTQLYQLRGRVGRSDREAFAYFFLPPDRSVSEDAMKRLDALTAHTELGSGFKIAMSDLEIRGPGNILGAEQSGNIMAIGFELYTRLLNESISESLRREEGEATEDIFPGSLLELRYEGFIPHSYIPEDRQKIAVYKKIAAIETPEGISRVRGEIEAQYGKTIEIIERLLRIAEIRTLANEMKIFSIREKDEYYEISLFEKSRVNRNLLLELLRKETLQVVPEHPEQLRISTIDEKRNKILPFEVRIEKLRELLTMLKEPSEG